MRIAIHKQTFADGRAYRYHISDEDGNLRYVAEPSGLSLPSPTRLVEFFDPAHRRVGRLQPPAVSLWRRGTRYQVFQCEPSTDASGPVQAQEPCAVIQEQWRLVDVLLLRLPRYQLQVGGHGYVAQGSRYGERYYEIYEEQAQEPIAAEQTSEERARVRPLKVGYIQRPASGPTYVVETEVELFDQAPLVLAALAILADMELYA